MLEKHSPNQRCMITSHPMHTKPIVAHQKVTKWHPTVTGGAGGCPDVRLIKKRTGGICWTWGGAARAAVRSWKYCRLAPYGRTLHLPAVYLAHKTFTGLALVYPALAWPEDDMRQFLVDAGSCCGIAMWAAMHRRGQGAVAADRCAMDHSIDASTFLAFSSRYYSTIFYFLTVYHTT